MNARGIVCLLGLFPVLSFAQDAKTPEAKTEAKKPEPFTLTITGEIDPELAPVVGKLSQLYFESYPKLVARFENPKKPAERHIRIVFERGLKVPAFCSGSKITISVEWMKKNPNDVGLLTHELTHAVQAYPRFEPGWLTEGLADYARQVYGPKETNGWSLPERLTKRQSYKNSYRITAKFLVWLEEKHPGTVDKVHRKMQDREFNVDEFKTITGKTIDELWDACVADLEPKK
jgi:Peptidase of plants and bacteria